MKYMQVTTNTEVPYDSQWVLRCTLHDSIFLIFKWETFLHINSSWGCFFSAKFLWLSNGNRRHATKSVTTYFMVHHLLVDKRQFPPWVEMVYGWCSTAISSFNKNSVKKIIQKVTKAKVHQVLHHKKEAFSERTLKKMTLSHSPKDLSKKLPMSKVHLIGLGPKIISYNFFRISKSFICMMI